METYKATNVSRNEKSGDSKAVLVERLENRALFTGIANVAPVVTTDLPHNTFVTVGDSATFTAAASGTPAPTVKWEVSVDGVGAFTPVTNNASATTTTLVIPDAPLTATFNEYEAVFTNSTGSATTSASTLFVDEPASGAPTVTTQPTSVTLAAAGDTATFAAAATGTPTPTVQWYVEPKGSDEFKSITDNSSATTPTLTLADEGASADGSQYEAVFTNSAGNITTNIVTLSIAPPSSTPTVTASLEAKPLKTSQKYYYFTVTYDASAAIDTATFGKHNVFVTGPSDYEQSATFIASTASNSGRSVAVTYRVSSVGSKWSASTNGRYHVYVRPSQVKDKSGDFVAGGILGPFKMLIA